MCLQCRRENQLSTARCPHCGSISFENFPANEALNTLLIRSRKRIIGCWITIALFGTYFFYIGTGPWYFHLLGGLFFQIMMAGWFGLMLYTQTKAADQTSEGEAFRGPMPVWRAVFWTCFAAVGVFCCIYFPQANHPWTEALLGALFCSFFIGVFAFLLNWVRGEHGKVWARRYSRYLFAVYFFAALAGALVKIWGVLSHNK